MAGLPLVPRVTLHLLTVFTVIAFLLIILFPTLSYAKSIYRPNEDSPTFIAVPPSTEPTGSPSVILKFQQTDDQNFRYDEAFATPTVNAIDSPSKTTVGTVLLGILHALWIGCLFIAHLLIYTIRPLQIVTLYIFNKFLFFAHPFILLATGVCTVFIAWPVQFVSYLVHTLYPLYVFLACASIVGLLVGGVGSLLASFINNRLFRHPPPQESITPALRPQMVESAPESVISSGTATPLPFRVPPPSKYPSLSGLEDIPHILDTNALFSSFSLPAPPPTPPGILYSAPTPVGSISGGVVGETIFEEDDDSDDKTPVASVESFAIAGGKTLARPESAHERSIGPKDLSRGVGTWHGRHKREDVDVQGIDWRNEGIRKRKV